MIDSKGQGQWSYARSDRFTGWPARSLCQMAAVSARMRCRTRIRTPAGVLPPCRSRSIWSLQVSKMDSAVWHGLGPYDVVTGATLPAKPGTPPNWQDVFGQAMVKLCQKDNSIVGITAAMPSGTGLKLLEKTMPNRYYDVGIAEEHAVLFACGMAT